MKPVETQQLQKILEKNGRVDSTKLAESMALSEQLRRDRTKSSMNSPDPSVRKRFRVVDSFPTERRLRRSL
jgi:hypothetical protein